MVVGTGRIEIDPRWLESYADRVDHAADDMRRVRDAMKSSPLRPESFGEVGRTLGSARGYARAAELLNGQLGRACDVLASAAKGLHDVAKHYGHHDEDNVQQIKKADRR